MAGQRPQTARRRRPLDTEKRVSRPSTAPNNPYFSDVDQFGESALSSDVFEWTSQEVGDWISHVGYPQYQLCFTGNNVYGSKLARVEMKHLPQMGICQWEHSKDIMVHVRTLLAADETRKKELKVHFEERQVMEIHDEEDSDEEEEDHYVMADEDGEDDDGFEHDVENAQPLRTPGSSSGEVGRSWEDGGDHPSLDGYESGEFIIPEGDAVGDDGEVLLGSPDFLDAVSTVRPENVFADDGEQPRNAEAFEEAVASKVISEDAHEEMERVDEERMSERDLTAAPEPNAEQAASQTLLGGLGGEVEQPDVLDKHRVEGEASFAEQRGGAADDGVSGTEEAEPETDEAKRAEAEGPPAEAEAAEEAPAAREDVEALPAPAGESEGVGGTGEAQEAGEEAQEAGEEAGEEAQEAGEKAGEEDGEAGEKAEEAQEAGEKAGEEDGEAGEAREEAGEAGEKAGEEAREAGESVDPQAEAVDAVDPPADPQEAESGAEALGEASEVQEAQEAGGPQADSAQG